jgi:hypothetical protein
MVPMARRRLVVVVAMTIVTGVGMIAGTPAYAAPRPGPDAVQVSGKGMPKPLTVRAKTDPLLFAALLDQVSWLNNVQRGNSAAAADLGPHYSLALLVNNTPTHIYVLYPLASGGPRAFRPAKQPGRTVAAAWFFGRLTMAETLRAAGVPVPAEPNGGSGGIGGGARALAERTAEAKKGYDWVPTDLRVLLLLNVTVIVLITAGLAGIALLVRRRTG